MEMRKLLFTTCFVFAIFTCLSAQLELISDVYYPSNDEENIEVDYIIRDPANQIENDPKFNHPPYYQAFTIFGDGNFQLIGDLGTPLLPDVPFAHCEFRNLQNDYPSVTLLISRKDDDDPPPPEEELLIPLTPFINTSETNRQSNDNPIPSITIPDEEKTPLNKMPMIEDSDRFIELGLSHYHMSGWTEEIEGGEVKISETYFLQAGRIHAFPIAYKPASAGYIMFFYDAGLPNAGENKYDHFTYFKEIKLDPNNTFPCEPDSDPCTQCTPCPPIGTILPNYYQPSDPLPNLSINTVRQKARAIDEQNANDIYAFNSLLPDNIKCLVHFIDENEATKLAETNGELRLFHFLKSMEPTFEDSSSNAKFLAVLYDQRDIDAGTINVDTTARLKDLKDLNVFDENINWPSSFIRRDSPFGFVDFAVIEAQKGEPDDPGGLKITKIETNGNDYTLSFNLEFCNSPDASPADIFKIFLRSRLINLDTILTDIKINPQCPNTFEDVNLGDCQFNFNLEEGSERMDNSTGLPNKKLAYYITSSLGADECANIQFTAKIKAENLDILTKHAVMDYCVKFAADGSGTVDVGEYCSSNDVLQDSICTRNTHQTIKLGSPQKINCYPNPVLRIQKPCSILVKCLCIGLTILFIFCFIFWFRSRSKPS